MKLSSGHLFDRDSKGRCSICLTIRHKHGLSFFYLNRLIDGKWRERGLLTWKDKEPHYLHSFKRILGWSDALDTLYAIEDTAVDGRWGII